MKSWIKRFGMLAVLGVIAGSALVAGCSNSETTEEAAPAANTTEGAPPADATPAEPAGEGS